jgi:hypothetical protein
LKHHIDRPFIRRHARHVFAVDEDAPRTGRFETAQHAQQRGLAATRSPEKAKDLALVDLQGDVIDRLEIAERLGDA